MLDNSATNVLICKSDNGTVNDWRRTVAGGIAAAMATPEGRHVRVLGDADCKEDKIEIACAGGIYDKVGQVLACSPYTLERLVRVTAWFAIKHAEHPAEDYETFRRREPTPLGMKALFASDVGVEDAAFTAGLDRLRTESENSDSGTAKSRTDAIFKATFDIVLAALFGHEASHLESAPPYCAITKLSRIEESGLWKTIMHLQSSDDLFRSLSPVAGEISADRCATRRIRAAVDALAGSGLDPSDQDFARRAAADIISTMLLTPITPGTAKRPFYINKSYLYPPLRILALAGEIGLAGPKPATCGGTAENLVEATQDSLKISPGQEQIPDDMEAMFPKGVVDAWERKSDWSAASFSCD